MYNISKVIEFKCLYSLLKIYNFQNIVQNVLQVSVFACQSCYVLKVEKHTRALKVVGTLEHLNERALVANTAVHNIYISNYISPPSLNSAWAEQHR